MARRKYTSRNLETLRRERKTLESKFSPRQKHILEGMQNFDLNPSVQYLQEEFGSDYFANITLDAQHNRLVGAYSEVPTCWEAASNVRAVNDFKLQHAIAASGFEDLPTVKENGEYRLERIEDEDRGTYRIVKRGFLFGLTLEAQANDELSAFSDKMAAFGRTAARTLDRFVMTTNLSDNPTLYDGVALVHSSHNNAVSGAASGLSEANLKAAIQLMKKQTGIKATEDIELRPMTLVVHPDDEFLARELLMSPSQILETRPSAGAATFRGNTNTLNGMIPNLKVTVRMAAAGVGDATRPKWALLANPMECDMFELGFYRGMRMPETFTEDPGSPAEFDTDVNRWKVRHIYGGTWRDFRGVVGGNFA